MLSLALVAAAVMALAGLASLAFPRGGRAGERVFALLMAVGGALLCTAGLRVLLGGAGEELTLHLVLPARFRLDALAAAFLLPIGLVPALGAVYGLEYWSEAEHPRGAARLRVFLGLLAGSMACVILAADAVVLLQAWEVMALATYFLVVARDDEAEVRAAGWVYFVATHVGTLALLALFALLRASTGGFELVRLPESALTGGATAAVLVLALAGFGLKAGVVPLHVWLPGAHASAPSHVSAVLSGVLLKVGVYGILRVLWLVPALPDWWGGVLLAVGGLTCVFGIALATAQGDYKRLLAYSSIENVGVIVLALGLFSLGRSRGEPALAAVGLTAAILHAWNHALFKPLLFLVAGALLHATDTRRMNALGGLAGRMPRVAALAAAGSLAICALPPLNGFIGEWVLYSGLLRGLAGSAGATGLGLAAAAAVLAMTGALALVAFVKLFGTVFLGESRTSATSTARDPGALMLAPMAVLALLCLAIGLAPASFVRLGLGAARAWGELAAVTEPVASGSLNWIARCSGGALLLAVLASWGLHRRVRVPREARVGTWDCGYAAPSARMQYGESSLVQALTGLFAWLIVPRRGAPRAERPFPPALGFRSEAPDVVLDRGLLPAARGLERSVLRLRRLQRGRIQVYVLYILLALLVLLLIER